ncbi:MAG: cysteine desulfurase [Bacteroidales bacterium]|nr:cysteine desulfurase [Bacteroidales bacterium]
MFDIQKIRSDFPLLQRTVYGKKLIYLDNAATTQKPQVVINRLQQYYTQENTNIHRGAHFLANEATEAYENGRERVRKFINAQHKHEILFTRGTTESINLIAHSFVQRFVNEGDEVLISAMEHHSNIVPWQLACEIKHATIKVIPMNQNGELLLDQLPHLLTDKTRIVAVTAISNALGTVNPLKKIIQIAHEHHIPVLVDGAQSVPHARTNVQDLDCDFFCFSGHKMYAPMGIGVVYGKEALLNELPPYQGGGEMVKHVTFAKTTYNELPFKFEAGTPNVEGVLGLHSAIDYLEDIGFENIEKQETDLFQYAFQKFQQRNDVRLIGTAAHHAGVISFLMNDIHPYDTGTILDHLGVAVRTGHHCAQPIMDFYEIPGTVRASFSFYNTKEEIDQLFVALDRVRQMFG